MAQTDLGTGNLTASRSLQAWKTQDEGATTQERKRIMSLIVCSCPTGALHMRSDTATRLLVTLLQHPVDRVTQGRNFTNAAIAQRSDDSLLPPGSSNHIWQSLVTRER